MLFYSSVALRFTQDTIKVGHRVKVVDGEQWDLVSHVIDVSDGTVKVDLHTNNEIAPLLISVHTLSNLYLPSDHVKYRYDDENEHGIVSAVQQDTKTLTDLCGKGHTDGGTYNTINTTYTYLPCQILAHTDTMEPWSPTTNYYRFTMGLWVKFTGPINSGWLKCCRYITVVEDGLATIVDEHTFAEVSNKLSSAVLANIRTRFNINTAKLEVTASQGPSIPAGDPVHPLMGRWVIITTGPHRSYKGVVREIGNTSATVELHALFNSSVSLCQSFPLNYFKLMCMHYVLFSTLLIMFI